MEIFFIDFVCLPEPVVRDVRSNFIWLLHNFIISDANHYSLDYLSSCNEACNVKFQTQIVS